MTHCRKKIVWTKRQLSTVHYSYPSTGTFILPPDGVLLYILLSLFLVLKLHYKINWQEEQAHCPAVCAEGTSTWIPSEHESLWNILLQLDRLRLTVTPTECRVGQTLGLHEVLQVHKGYMVSNSAIMSERNIHICNFLKQISWGTEIKTFPLKFILTNAANPYYLYHCFLKTVCFSCMVLQLNPSTFLL